MQDLFGSMRQRAGDLMSDVGSEVDRQRQIRQLEKQINMLEQELHSSLALIGQQVVELHQQGRLASPNLEESCRRLLEGNSYLEDLNQQKQALQRAPGKEERTCHSCSGELPDEGKFCPHCGASIKVQTSVVVWCGHCGAELTPDAAYCADCGQPLDSTTVMNTAAADAVVASQVSDQGDHPGQPDEVSAQAVLTDGPVCVHCQTPLEPEAQFCRNCGWLIEGVPESVALGETETAQGAPAEVNDLAVAVTKVADREAVTDADLPDKTELEPKSGDDLIVEKPTLAEEVAVTMEVNAAAETTIKEPTETEAVELTLEELVKEESGPINEAPEADMFESNLLDVPVDITDEQLPTSANGDMQEELKPLTDVEPVPINDDDQLFLAEPMVTNSVQSCSDCGGLLRAGATFCPSCGKQLLAPTKIDSQLTRFHCGVLLDDSMSFCPECGAQVPFDETAHRFCSTCGAHARIDARFCPDCGQPMDTVER